ncbi:MAG TPA: sensor domain-containing diguanylate cyclase [Chloroflexota bacterium]|nr:sensor domain-containing diguanylate cyclase [Chloroflexota bacterium]
MTAAGHSVPLPEAVRSPPGFPDLRVSFKLALSVTRAGRGSLLVRKRDGLVIQAAQGLPRRVVELTTIPVGKGIAGWVAERCQPLLIEQESQLPRELGLRRRGYRTSSFVSVPIRLGRKAVGVINVADQEDGASFSRRELDILRLVARQASALIGLHRSVVEALWLADVDYLTGLANRRALDHRLPVEIERMSRYRTALSALMMDLNDFKQINDRWGHHAGDQVLKVTAEVLRKATRASDVAFRYGGDEFLILLPHANSEQAVHPAERLLEELCSAPLPRSLRGRVPALTGSVGICSAPEYATNSTDLIARADEALRLAKMRATGVEVWRPGLLTRGADIGEEGLGPALNQPASSDLTELGAPL